MIGSSDSILFVYVQHWFKTADSDSSLYSKNPIPNWVEPSEELNILVLNAVVPHTTTISGMLMYDYKCQLHSISSEWALITELPRKRATQ
jgi:hypothetical protein